MPDGAQIPEPPQNGTPLTPWLPTALQASGSPRHGLDDRVDLRHHRVLAQQLAEEVVVAGGEPKPPVAGAQDQAVVGAARGVVLLNPRQEDLVVGVLVGEVVRVAADHERAVQKALLPLDGDEVVEHDRLEVFSDQRLKLALDPIRVEPGDGLLHVGQAVLARVPQVPRQAELGEHGDVDPASRPRRASSVSATAPTWSPGSTSPSTRPSTSTLPRTRPGCASA